MNSKQKAASRKRKFRELQTEEQKQYEAEQARLGMSALRANLTLEMKEEAAEEARLGMSALRSSLNEEEKMLARKQNSFLILDSTQIFRYYCG